MFDSADSADVYDLEAHLDEAMKFWPELKSDRRRNENRSMLRAFFLISRNPECVWLMGGVTSDHPDSFDRLKLKKSLLSELGRILNRRELVETAERICKLKPKSREGVAMLRRWRLGEKAGDAEELAGAIRRVIARYRVDHTAGKGLVIDALNRVALNFGWPAE